MNAPFPFLCCCLSQRNTKQLQLSYYKRNTTKAMSPWAKFFSDVVKKLREDPDLLSLAICRGIGQELSRTLLS